MEQVILTLLKVKLAMRCAFLLFGGGRWGAIIMEHAEAGLKILSFSIWNKSTKVSTEFDHELVLFKANMGGRMSPTLILGTSP